VIISVIYAVIATMAGLILSFYMDLRPGGTIVLIAVAMLIATMSYGRILRRNE
jgi:zinc transport system permease protein